MLVYCCCSGAKSCPTLFDPVDWSTPGFPVLHYLPEFAQIYLHWVGDTIQPSHLLPPPSSPALSLSQHQGLFQWVGSSHQMAKVLELRLQHQSFQWVFSVDFFQDWLVWFPCCPRNSWESSPAPQFESIILIVIYYYYVPNMSSSSPLLPTSFFFFNLFYPRSKNRSCLFYPRSLYLSEFWDSS